MNLRICSFFLLLPASAAFSQESPVKVSGKVVDVYSWSQSHPVIPQHIVIVNKRTNTGTFADPDGSFSLMALKTDTLRFTATGYTVKNVCFKDSVSRKEYNITVKLAKLLVVIKEVEVFPVKKLEEVQKEIDKIGTVKKTSKYSDYVGVYSPITYLYERFNKMEQSKRWVAEQESMELKRQVLKDLFRIYVRYDIIQLSDEEFDEFINYCYFSLTDKFIKNATEFELVMAIKEKYGKFSTIKKSARTTF